MSLPSKDGRRKHFIRRPLDVRDKFAGEIKLKCTKFTEWLESKSSGEKKWSDNRVLTRGLAWQLILCKGDVLGAHLNVHVKCQLENEDAQYKIDWSCHANVELRVQYILTKLKEPCYQIIGSKSKTFHSGDDQCKLSFDKNIFENLLTPNNCFLDVDGALHISVTIKIEAPKCVSFVAKPDLLVVNGVAVGVNKYHLASKSKYFERFFFGKEYMKNNTLLIEFPGNLIDPPANVEDFKRLIDTMHPQNRPLDDQCIEGVMHLANRFWLAEEEGKCRHFLYTYSKRSAIFKYRMADTYGFDRLKMHVLKCFEMKKFLPEELAENRLEYAKLTEEARLTLNASLVQWSNPKIFEADTNTSNGPSETNEPSSKRAREQK